MAAKTLGTIEELQTEDIQQFTISDVEEVRSIDESIQPTSGRRRRWDKSETAVEDLVEDLKKPRRKQWAKGSRSAEIRNLSGKKIIVPERSATAEPARLARPRSSR